MGVRVGIDLVRAATVREAIQVHGERYLKRVYTDGERDETDDSPEGLAMRFAAKEAVMKALAPREEPLPWRTIAVRRDPQEGFRVVLSGEAAALAARRGIGAVRVSLARRREGAAAVAVAEGVA